MYRATGYPELIRAFRLNLTVEGLRPRTVQNYVRDVARFTDHLDGHKPRSVTITPLDQIAALRQLFDSVHKDWTLSVKQHLIFVCV